LRLFVLILARTAFVGWLALCGLLAVASLVANPGPFVVIGFSLGGLPVWVVVRRRRWIVNLAIATFATAVPVILLAEYGADEGGVSGVDAIAALTFGLGALALGLTWLGMAAGRLVWRPPESWAQS
jgi:hypothetical protein